MANAAEVMVQALENERVKYIFGIPGEENIDFLEAVSQSKIQFVLTRHEQGAGFMADVYGRLTGRAGVCLATLGPGATNLFTPVADANLDRAPLVAITGQAGTSQMHKESHQYIDIVSMFRSITKWNTRISSPDIVAEAVRKAFKLAEAEKPGATHLELPEDIAELAVENPEYLEVRKVRRPTPDPKAVARAVDLLNKSKKPLILAGNGTVRKRATKQLRELLDKTKIGICNTFMGKGAAGHEYEYNLFTIGLQARDHVAFAFQEADLIIAIGYDIVEYSPRFWNPDGKKKIIHIDFNEAEVDYWYNPEVELVGDIAAAIWCLNEFIGNDFPQGRGEFVMKHRKNILADIHEFDNSEHFPFKPQKIIHDVRAVMGENDILISDVGAHKLWVARSYIAYEPNTCLISNGFASMGIALPGGIAAKLVYPDRKIMTISGDGGFLMNVQELETAVRLKTPTVNMVWSDGTLGLIEWKQQNKFGRAYGTRFENPDWVKMAESFGAIGIKVSKGDYLKEVFRKAFSYDKPVVIDCPVDYTENIRLTQRLGQLIAPI